MSRQLFTLQHIRFLACVTYFGNCKLWTSSPEIKHRGQEIYESLHIIIYTSGVLLFSATRLNVYHVMYSADDSHYIIDVCCIQRQQTTKTVLMSSARCVAFMFMFLGPVIGGDFALPFTALRGFFLPSIMYSCTEICSYIYIG